MATGTINVMTNESGSYYCKMPDGTLICWGGGAYTPDSSTGTAWGNLYYYAVSVGIPFPIEFISDPQVVVSRRGGKEGMVSWATWNTQKITTIDIASGASSITSGTFNIAWIAIGRWK